MAEIPTEKAWDYFQKHLDDIRSIIEVFLFVPQWQSIVGPFAGPTEHSMQEFDEAVASRNSRKLSSIMNDAWGRAPESREVYRIPGFTEMCNLLDGTIEGWDEDKNEKESTHG